MRLAFLKSLVSLSLDTIVLRGLWLRMGGGATDVTRLHVLHPYLQPLPPGVTIPPGLWPNRWSELMKRALLISLFEDARSHWSSQ